MPVPGFDDTNCPLCGNFDPEPWAGLLADAAVKWREAELRGDGTDNGDLYAVRNFADKLIANRTAEQLAYKTWECTKCVWDGCLSTDGAAMGCPECGSELTEVVVPSRASPPSPCGEEGQAITSIDTLPFCSASSLGHADMFQTDKDGK